MDIFGHVVLAMLPAIGGGTIRDIILDAPVFWLGTTLYVWLAVVAAILVFSFPPRVGKRLAVLEWADAVGLALFCVLGASKSYALTDSITISVTMGIVTAAAGGMMRDIVCNEVPLILRKEIYATAALAGALILIGLNHLGVSNQISIPVTVAFTAGVRLLAIRYAVNQSA